MPQGNAIWSFAHGNGMFVGVGNGGSIITSSDGIVWSLQESGTGRWLGGVTRGEGIFVAVGNEGTIITSANGVSWTQQHSGTTMALYGITFAGGLFVAVGEWGTVLTSTDGVDWTEQEKAVLNDLFAVSFGNGIFLASGEAGVVITSPDGISWIRTTGANWYSIVSLAYGNGVFVGVSNEMGMVVVSRDAIVWEVMGVGGGSDLYNVVFAQGHFLVIGIFDSIFTSTDGFIWERHTTGNNDNHFGSAGYGNGLFVAGGAGTLFTSPDCIQWTERSSRLFSGMDAVLDFVYGGGMFVVATQRELQGAIVVSSDGVTWETTFVGNAWYYRTVGYGNGRFVALGATGGSITTIATSLDGISWSETSLSLPWIVSIAYGNGTFVAVGESIMTSSDGINWSEGLAGYTLNRVAYGNGLFVAVGATSTILTSPDGITWTRRIAPLSTDFLGVSYGNGTFVAVGHYGAIVSSYDGIGWTLRSAGLWSSLVDITYGFGSFMAVGWGGTLITSPDGRSWTIRDPRVSRDLHKVAAGKGTFVVTGYMDPIIIQSDELMALPIISATPRHLMFGNVRVGEFAQENVVITNVGKANLSISSAADPGPPFAKVVDGCSGRTFIPGSSCIVSYRFSPATVGDTTRSSLVASNDTESNPFHIYLSGRGVSPEIIVTPSTVDFGPIIPGEASLPQEVTVRNDGSVNLLVGTLSVNGTDASQFFISGNSCNGATLTPGGSCSAFLRFAPATIGPKSGNLIIPSNDADESNVTIPLSGIGGTPEILVEPVAVEFGFVSKGQNRNQAVLVSNIGTASLELGMMTNPSFPFSIGSTTCVPGTILQPGENCSIIAIFSPASNGSFSSQIAIESDDPERPTVVTELSGASGPDLTGALNALALGCKDSTKGLRCKVSGSLLIRNLGTEKASGFLRFYLSSDESYDVGSDTFLKQIGTGRVGENGSSVLKRVSLKLPLGTSASGQYMIAVIDPDNGVIEGDETNNINVYGPIP